MDKLNNRLRPATDGVPSPKMVRLPTGEKAGVPSPSMPAVPRPTPQKNVVNPNPKPKK